MTGGHKPTPLNDTVAVHVASHDNECRVDIEPVPCFDRRRRDAPTGTGPTVRLATSWMEREAFPTHRAGRLLDEPR